MLRLGRTPHLAPPPKKKKVITLKYELHKLCQWKNPHLAPALLSTLSGDLPFLEVVEVERWPTPMGSSLLSRRILMLKFPVAYAFSNCALEKASMDIVWRLMLATNWTSLNKVTCRLWYWTCIEDVLFSISVYLTKAFVFTGTTKNMVSTVQECS